MERKLILEIGNDTYCIIFKCYPFKVKILMIGKLFKNNIYIPIKFNVISNKKSTVIDYLQHFKILVSIKIKNYISKLSSSNNDKQ